MNGADGDGDASASPPWYAEGLRFTCTACGACCRGPRPGYVFVSEREIRRLARHLELELDAFGRHYLRSVRGQLVLVEKANKDCVFWADGRGCTVYSLRPAQCRQFPFWPEVLASEEGWRDEAEACEGIDSGERVYDLAEIEGILGGRRGTRPGRRPRRLPSA